MKQKKTLATLAAAALSVGTLAACGSSTDESGGGGGGASASGGGGGKSITIGYIDWDEDIVVTHMWKRILEDKGYKVTLKHLADAGPAFVALDKGQIDLFLDGWLPVTHKSYWDKYGKNLTDVQTWYDNAKLTIAVPKYMKDVNSIEDLKKVKSKVNGQIVGIEPGAGLTAATKKAIKSYGLDYNLKTSSTPAMLASLKKATDAKKPTVVTLWRPHWAYEAYPVKDLKDPKGVMGKAEKVKAIGTKDFNKDFPEVTKMLKRFTMTDKQLSDLENKWRANKEKPQEPVDAWVKANPDFIKKITG